MDDIYLFFLYKAYIVHHSIFSLIFLCDSFHICGCTMSNGTVKTMGFFCCVNYNFMK